MAKKVKINKKQLSILVEYIKYGKVKPQLNESELLEEGAKEWAMAGLMALASMAGMAQDKLKGSDEGDLNHYIEAADEFKSKLADESSAEYNLFTQATKDMNAQNIEAIKNVDPKDEMVIKTFKTKNLGTATSKVNNDGGIITDIVITSDTVWNDIPDPLEIDSIIETNIEGNLFVSGGFDLNEDVANELSFQFKAITTSNSELVKVTINSSTDKEPVTKELAQLLISKKYSGDNEGLAKARKDGIYNHLKKMGVDTSLIDLNIEWEQGPDVYSPDMGDDARTSARELPGTSSARNVGVTWNVKKMLQGEATASVKKVIEEYLIEVTTLKEPLKGGKVTTTTGGQKTKKLKTPKVKLKGKTIKCELFGQ